MLQKKLSENNTLFIIWAILAAFGAYFCTYAFRKPFTAGVFENQRLFGISYKSVLIIAQVFGYVISKFLGVKVISELKSKNRIKLILLLIVLAQASLLLFGFLPKKLGFWALFLNGLPLGMVWGIIYSYLEGRRFTELLSIGLSLNMILTSGVLKTLYLIIQNNFNFSEFWMPSIIGFIMFPFFLFFVWMLSKIPPPKPSDILLKEKRLPMTKIQKNKLLNKYSLGIFLTAFAYMLLTGIRDFRDNFIVEILGQIIPNVAFTFFAKTEMVISLIVMIIVASLVLIKNNKVAYQISSIIMLFCMVLLGFVTNAFKTNTLDPMLWMILSGVMFYLPYIIIQVTFFDRIIAFLKLRANAGFFVYLCDSLGYMCSVVIILLKETMAPDLNYTQYLITYSFVVALLGFLFILLQYLFFSTRNSNLKFSIDY